MQTTIQCGKCKKRTMHHELGVVVYVTDEPVEVLVRDPIMCPKCKAEISNDCSALVSQVMIAPVAAGIGPTPEHLQGIHNIRGSDREAAREKCAAKLTL